MQFVWMYWHGDPGDPSYGGGARGSELLYSMRSVEKNYQGSVDIVLVGDRPDWYHGKFISKPQIPPTYRRHFRDYYSKILKASTEKSVNRFFVCMQDDIYFLNPVTEDEVKTSWHCRRVNRQNVWDAGRAKNAWRRGIREAFKIVNKEVMFDYATHLPQYLDSQKVLQMELTHGLLNDYHNWENIYGNTWRTDPKYCKPFLARIRKTRTQDQWTEIKSKCKVMNHLHKVWNKDLESFLESEFPDPGSFEFPPGRANEFIPAPKPSPAPILKNDRPLTFVWPYIESALGGEELRLSIASVERFYQGKAKTLVIGDRPGWYDGMYIKKPKRTTGNFRSFKDVYQKLLVAQNTQLTGDTYVWMMDDIYFTRPLSFEELSVPRYQSKKNVEELNKWSPSNKWLTLKKKTMLKVAEEKGVCYDFATHLPHLVVKRTLDAALRGLDLNKDMYLWEILYGNYRADVPPEKCNSFFFRTTRAINDVNVFRSKASKIFNNGNHGWCDELREFLNSRIYGNSRYGDPENSITISSSSKPRLFAVIPYSERDKYRKRNMNFVRQWAEKRFDQVILSESAKEAVFNKSMLVNRAIEELGASGDDVIAVIDADIVIDDNALKEAVEKARSHSGLVFPFNSIRKLCPNDTRYFINRGHKKMEKWTSQPGNYSCDKPPNCPGCIFLVSKSNWDLSGGMDERFTEWGREDTAYRNHCRSVLGMEQRLDCAAVHLYHPVNGRRPRRNKAIYRREYMNLEAKQVS